MDARTEEAFLPRIGCGLGKICRSEDRCFPPCPSRPVGKATARAAVRGILLKRASLCLQVQNCTWRLCSSCYQSGSTPAHPSLGFRPTGRFQTCVDETYDNAVTILAACVWRPRTSLWSGKPRVTHTHMMPSVRYRPCETRMQKQSLSRKQSETSRLKPKCHMTEAVSISLTSLSPSSHWSSHGTSTNTHTRTDNL